MDWLGTRPLPTPNVFDLNSKRLLFGSCAEKGKELMLVGKPLLLVDMLTSLTRLGSFIEGVFCFESKLRRLSSFRGEPISSLLPRLIGDVGFWSSS